MPEEYFNNKRVLHSRLYPMVFYPEHHKADKDGFVNISIGCRTNSWKGLDR